MLAQLPLEKKANRQLRFTPARLEQIKPPASGRVTYYDLGWQGLALRVTCKGAKTFLVYRRLRNGSPRRVCIGRFPEVSLQAAREQTSEILSQISKGRDPVADRRHLREETTLGELYEEFLVQHSKARKRSSGDDESLYRCHISSLKSRRLSSITPSEVQAWHARIGKETPIRANRAHSLLRKMFNFARSRGFSGGNPAIGVQRFRERSRERFMSPDELSAFLFALEREPDQVARDFFFLALLTGARRSNVLSMRWNDLDLTRGIWRIPGEFSKNGDPLTVVLAKPVIERLNERRETAASIWVLPSRTSQTGHWTEPKKAWQRTLARAELYRMVDLLVKQSGREALLTDYQGADEEILLVRRETLARRIKDNRDPLEIVVHRYREKVTEAGIDPNQARYFDLRIHDLRRTLGSWQADLGSSLIVIGRSLNHRSTGTTAIYARLSLDPVRESVERATTAMLKTRPPVGSLANDHISLIATTPEAQLLR